MERLTPHIIELSKREFIGAVKWFTNELQTVTNIDVYAVPFDRSAGYQIYENERFRVLLIRFEDLRRVASEALGSFFSVPSPPLHEKNVGDRKAYSDLYRRFKADAVFPDSVLDFAYESQLAQHLYNPEEIAGFRARWSRLKATPAS